MFKCWCCALEVKEVPEASWYIGIILSLQNPQVCLMHGDWTVDIGKILRMLLHCAHMIVTENRPLPVRFKLQYMDSGAFQSCKIFHWNFNLQFRVLENSFMFPNSFWKLGIIILGYFVSWWFTLWLSWVLLFTAQTFSENIFLVKRSGNSNRDQIILKVWENFCMALWSSDFDFPWFYSWS